MRICIVSDLYYPYPGGVSEHVHHLGIELMKLGHEVKILTTNYLGYSQGNMDESHVIRVGVGVPIFVNQSISILPVGVGLYSRKIRRIVRGQFDIIHLHTPYFFIPIVVLKHSNCLNVMTFHANAPPLLWYKCLARLLRPYSELIDGAIAVSPSALATMRRLVQSSYTIIPNGIDTNRFSPEVKPLPSFVGSNYKPTILFVGRFEPRKGLKYLLHAFTKVCTKIPNARLVIVGKGLVNKLKSQNSKLKNVYFAGYVLPEDMPRYYASCDVFCSPATGRESFGIVLLEAMSSGKPVVATNIDGYRGVVSDGKDGILVEPANSDALADALIKVLTDKELSTKLSIEGRKTALKYSWPKIAKEVESFYYKLLSK